MYEYTKIYFKSRHKAVASLYKLRDLANNYGIVSVADYYEVCDDVPLCNYIDNKYGWPKMEIDLAHVALTERKDWVIVLPYPSLLEAEYDTKSSPTSYDKTPAPDILNITIMTNELESPGTYISDIFTQISKVKDRMINITIM